MQTTPFFSVSIVVKLPVQVLKELSSFFWKVWGVLGMTDHHSYKTYHLQTKMNSEL